MPDSFEVGPSERRISGRQREILAMASRGCADKEIALALGLSLPTVRTYWQRFFRANGVNNRVSAVMLYQRIMATAGTAESWPQPSEQAPREEDLSSDRTGPIVVQRPALRLKWPAIAAFVVLAVAGAAAYFLTPHYLNASVQVAFAAATVGTLFLGCLAAVILRLQGST